MKLFVADLHLGSPLFNKDRELIALFNKEEVKEIYIIGDVYDSWELDPLDIFYKHESLITTINFINKPVYIFIGNHDPNKEFMKEVFFNRPILSSMEVEICGRKTIITHGHEACKVASPAKGLFFIQYYAERWFKINPKDVLRGIWHNLLMKIYNKKDDAIVLKIEKEIYEYYRGKYDMIIVGHTHEGKIVQERDLLYVNTGCIVHKPTYVLSKGCSLFLEELDDNILRY